MAISRREFLSGMVLTTMTDITKIRPPTGVVISDPLHTPASQYTDGSPIALYAKSNNVASGSIASPNTAALTNPTPYPIEINEIRFHASVDDAGGAIPGMYGIKLDLDGEPIAQNFIPSWLFDESEQLVGGETQQTGFDPQVNPISASFYVWRLATPLLILPGETLNAEFQNFGLIGTDLNIDILYTGRVVVGHPLPRSRVLPYVAAWANAQVDLSSFETGSTVAIQVESTELDLVNKSHEVVIIKKLTGRLMVPFQTGYAGSRAGSDEQQPVIDMLFDAALRISNGYELTKDWVPFRLFFGRDTRAFPASQLVLNPGDYIMAQVQAVLRNITPYDNGGTPIYPSFFTPVIPQIGMVGERVVAI